MDHQKYIRIGLIVAVAFFVTSLTHAAYPAPKRFLPDIATGWNEIDPAAVYPGFSYQGLTPACSNCPSCTSDKYTFFVRKGKVNKLLVFFQGGGACWDEMNCIYASTCTRQETETVSTLTSMKGIFDFTRSDNPFKDWYVVYLPYCTGDLFWGAEDYEYVAGLRKFQHRGFVNFKVVLKWVQDNFACPFEVFVAGSSAGGYGAIMNYPYIKESYPLSLVYVLGDAANGVVGENFSHVGIYRWDIQIPTWILGSYTPDMTMGDIYANIAAEYPLMKLAQYTTAMDGTQIWFYNLQLDDNVEDPALWTFPTGDSVYDYTVVSQWVGTMLSYTHGTAAVAPNYRYYIGAGTDHTVLLSDKFYAEDSAQGVSFAQWVKCMVNNPFGVFGGPLQGIWKNVEAQ
jgi:hypothetical protein